MPKRPASPKLNPITKVAKTLKKAVRKKQRIDSGQSSQYQFYILTILQMMTGMLHRLRPPHKLQCEHLLKAQFQL